MKDQLTPKNTQSKMRHTRIIKSPVLTFLGPSESSINRSASLLKKALGLQEIKISNKSNDKENNLSGTKSCDEKLSFSSSTVLQCPGTNATFQFLSIPSSSSSMPGNDNNADYMLLACMTNQMHNGKENEGQMDDIYHAREYLASKILSSPKTSSSSSSSALSSKALSFWNKLMGRNPAMHALYQDENLPYVETSLNISIPDDVARSTSMNNDEAQSKAYLREIVLPYFEDEEDGIVTKSFFDSLSKPINPRTQRPMTGLYQWPQTSATNLKPIFIRPIPAGPEDQYLAPPSLVFQVPSSSFEIISNDNIINNNNNVQFRKIGFNGNLSNKGQYILSHESLNGIDIRVCPNTQLSTSFNEGEDALFAGSIDELQRSNSNNNSNIAMSNTNNRKSAELEDGDCWIEVRAMVKQYPNRLWEKYVAGSTNVWKRRRRKGKNVMVLLNKASMNKDTGRGYASNTFSAAKKHSSRIVSAPRVLFE